jgi:hypothetical protein
MRKVSSTKFTAGCCALAMLFSAVFHAAACARVVAAEPTRQSGRAQQSPQTKPPADVDDDDEEGESADGVAAIGAALPQATDPATILRKARFIFVRSDSAFVSGREVEDSLRKRKEFQAWGMVVTRNEAEADLRIEITRKPLTRRFTFSVIDPHTLAVVASGKTRSVLFGKKIANKVAEKFANRVKVYRPYPPAASNP